MITATGSTRESNVEQVETVLLDNYDRYYRLAYSYTHNEQDAGDIVQNGAYKAIRNAPLLKSREYCATWLYRIMLNEIFDFHRKRREFDREDILDLRAAIDALPHEEKAIVLLRFFEDCTLSEIADIMELNLNTVKSRLYRCLEKLKLDLSSEEIS